MVYLYIIIISPSFSFLLNCFYLNIQIWLFSKPVLHPTWEQGEVSEQEALWCLVAVWIKSPQTVWCFNHISLSLAQEKLISHLSCKTAYFTELLVNWISIERHQYYFLNHKFSTYTLGLYMHTENIILCRFTHTSLYKYKHTYLVIVLDIDQYFK